MKTYRVTLQWAKQEFTSTVETRSALLAIEAVMREVIDRFGSVPFERIFAFER